ncbi:MAG: sigma-70 family RNA polymerase sigma factor [Planctomycetales bacterium]|nr:sigma-70 family RNA polymerase sigma factor [Planctomycetales bacterium]
MSDAESREQEFLRLFASTQRQVHAYLLAWVLDPNTAADLLQETNIVLWQKFDHFEPGTNFFAWAREIARRVVLRHRQMNAGRMVMLPPQTLEGLAGAFAETEVPQGVHEPQRSALDGCLKKLSEADHELVMSRYAPGGSVTDMAARLNRPVNSVSQSLRRIRRALLECTQRALRTE